jgi:hypothetical protein
MIARSALMGAALLLVPALAPAQDSAFAFHDWTGGHYAAAKPVCTYKGVMTDAEIELCVGHAVQYSYAPVPEHAAASR